MLMLKKIMPRLCMVTLAFFFLASSAAQAQSTHTADQNGDGTFSLSELLRVVQFYQLGSLHCDAAGEEGFNPGAGDQTCLPHNSDYNLQDWVISFDELLRLIQLYNALGYVSCPGVGEDGFCPDPVTNTITLPGGVPLIMVQISGGSFQMGAYPGEQDSNSWELPQHTVNIAYTFQLGKFEVTQAQWFAVMGSFPNPQPLDIPNVPVVYVSWDDIQTFLTTLNGLGLGTFRLPSEAEWEYSCRAETSTRFYWEDDPTYTEIDAYAWYYLDSCNIGECYGHVVGEKLPNAWGLYDMSGNVFEWCQDWWHNDYMGAPTDGSAWEIGGEPYRVVRGGTWRLEASYVRSAFRLRYFPDERGYFVGFRLVREN